jgi:RimJ/RimL family protein N-acetyltransferase
LPSSSELLRRKIALALPGLLGVSEQFVGHPLIRDLYPEYLFTSHCIIRASVPLMEAAREEAITRAGGDPVAAALAPYLEQHIPEEQDHDEWLLDDLQLLGRARSEVLVRLPSPTVAALVGSQYYWIFHYHPVALLGYIAVLEGYPPSTAMIDELVAGTGYPREAFRTMLAHAELDPGHAEELDELLDELPLTREQSAAIGLNAMSTTRVLTEAFGEMVGSASH